MSIRFKLILILSLFSICLSANDFQVVEKNGKYGLKSTLTNQWTIEPVYEAIGWSDNSQSVNNELIGAKLNEKWALLTTDGSRVTQHLFVQLTPYLEGTFLASKRDTYSIRLKYGLINTKGKDIIPFDNDRLETTNNRLISRKLVNGSPRTGLINLQGKIIIPFQYESIVVLNERRISVVNLDSKAALFNLNGEALTSFDYENIQPYRNDYISVTYYGRKGLIDIDGTLIIPPIYKDFKLENGRASGLPFTQWDLFEDGKFQRSYFYDELFELDDYLMATNSGEMSSIIDRDDDYIFHEEQQSFKTSRNGLSIIYDKETSYYGVLNKRGEALLNINYDSIYFYDNFLAASIDKSGQRDWHLFDQNGERIGVYSYSSLKPYGKLFMALRNGKAGLLNKMGEEISPFLYDEIKEAKNGLSVVSYQGRKGLIDQQGHWVITPYNDSINVDKRRIYLEQGTQKKLVEFNGHVSTRTNDSLRLLSRGYTLYSDDGLALFNYKNERLLEPSYDSISNVNDNLYKLYRDNRTFFYRPSDGADFELDPEIDEILNYAEGYVKFKKDGQFGFVDETGKLRIANRYQEAQDFSEGFAAVKLIGNWGFIDKAENLIIQPSFEEVQPFYNRLAVVKEGASYGLIAPNTEVVLAIDYDDIIRKEDHILVVSQGLIGLADMNGVLIKDCQYDEISQLAPEVFKVRKGNNYGVINIKGVDLVPISYSQIKMYDNRFYGALPSVWETITTTN